jgi:hypothetical protein
MQDGRRHTHAFSAMLVNLGAYGDTGKFCFPLTGAPSPDMPETLPRFECADRGGRGGTICMLWLWVIWDFRR